MKNFKERMFDGETLHGCWINLGSTVSAEIVGRAGFDWVLIDLEHGSGDLTAMYQQLQVLEGTGPKVLVRTDELARSKVQRILDAGAGGIMFPQLQARREVEIAVGMMYYPPKGIRGMANIIRATHFGKHSTEYYADQEKNIVTIIQIETIQALHEIDSVASADGADVLFVGPSDLSLALGIFGQRQHPLYQQAIRDVAAAAAKYGKVAGVLLQDISEYEMYHALGYRFLACGSESSFVARSAGDMARQLNLKKTKL
ncbi:MAG TPA: aldolase/citrate lyase family protein [Chryseosolibacter sp.]